MELETIRAVYAGLTDATIGLNAQIDGLTKDTNTDALPTHVAAFYNYADHPWVARKTLNRDEAVANNVILPCVTVYLDQPPILDPEVETIYRNGSVPVVIAYLSIEADEGKRMRDALYVNRAIQRFLRRFDDNSNAAMRFRNNVNVYIAKSLTQYTPFQLGGDALTAAATLVTYQCRDHAP